MGRGGNACRAYRRITARLSGIEFRLCSNHIWATSSIAYQCGHLRIRRQRYFYGSVLLASTTLQGKNVE
jgi:hypothetical protein